MTTLDRSKQMNLVNEDLAQRHLRWRGSSVPRGSVSRSTLRAMSARRDLARLLYGGAGR